MEQKKSRNQAMKLLKNKRKYRQWRRTVTGLAAVVVLATVYLLIQPAITLGRGVLDVSTDLPETEPGKTILTAIHAEAQTDREETVFVLKADGNNAGLDGEQLEFDEEGIAAIQDEDGQNIQLHREYGEDGVTSYWFRLSNGQSSRFSLPWENGMTRYRTEEIAEETAEKTAKETTEETAEESDADNTGEAALEEEGSPQETDPQPQEEPETAGRTETVVEHEGNPEEEGSLNLSYGQGGTLEEAKENADKATENADKAEEDEDRTLTLAWKQPEASDAEMPEASTAEQPEASDAETPRAFAAGTPEAAQALAGFPVGIDSYAVNSGSFKVHVDMKPVQGGSPVGTGILDIFRIPAKGVSPSEWNNWWYMGYALRWIENSSEYAYCFEVGQSSSSNDIYGPHGSKWEDSSLYSALAYTMAHGAQKVQQPSVDSKYSVGGEGTWPLDYVITQLVAHALIADEDLNPSSSSTQHGWANEIRFKMEDVQLSPSPAYYRYGGIDTITFNSAQSQRALAIARQFFADAKSYGKWANNGYLDKISFEVNADSEPKLNGSNYEASFTVTPKSQSKDGTKFDHSSEFDQSSLKLIIKSGAPAEAKIEPVNVAQGKYKLVFPKSSLQAGKTYTITVQATGRFDREKVKNYKSSNPNNQSMGFWEKLTEDVKDEVSFKVYEPDKLRLNVKKVWDDWSPNYRPESVKVTLWRKSKLHPNGEWVSGSDKTLRAPDWTLPDSNDWKNLDKYDDGDNPYTYYVKEITTHSGYTFEGTTERTTSGTIVITNKAKQIDLGVKKVWTGQNTKKPDSLFVMLKRKSDAIPNGEEVAGSGKSLNENNNWELAPNECWEHLPIADKDGNIYTYYVHEPGVPEGFQLVGSEEIKGDEAYNKSNHQFTIEIENKGIDTSPPEPEPTDLEFKLRKVDYDTPSKELGGAVFTLTDNMTVGDSLATAVSRYTDGVATFNGLEDIMTVGKSYYIYESSPPPGYEADGGHIEIVRNSNNTITIKYNGFGSYGDISSGYVDFIVKNKGKDDPPPEPDTYELNIIKWDETQTNKLKGAVFELRKSQSGSAIDKQPTDDTGKVRFQNIEPGTYYLYETKAPSGYQTPSGYVKLELSENGTWEVLTNNYSGLWLENGTFHAGTSANMKNKPTPPDPDTYELNIIKKDKETKEALKGAKFNLENTSTGITKPATADANGKVIFEDLIPGYYKLTETQAPSGYEKPTGFVNLQLQDSGKWKVTSNGYPGLWDSDTIFDGTVEVVMYNEPNTPPPDPDTYQLQIVKKDETGKNTLKGAKFQLLSSETGPSIAEEDSDENGLVVFSELSPGDYWLVETRAPEGYQTPPGGSVSLRLDENGYWEVVKNNMYDGLWMQEVNFSQYLLVEMRNKPKSPPEPETYELKIVKKDKTTKAALQGAEFLLRNTETGLGTYKTVDEKGKVVYDNLKPGTYVLTETKAPSGYVEPNGSVELKLDDDGDWLVTKNNYPDLWMTNGYFNETVEVEMLNEPDTPPEPKKHILQIQKYGQSPDRNPLSGAQFTLYKGALYGEEVDQKSTIGNGQVIFNDLEPGEYFLVETKAPNGYQKPNGHVELKLETLSNGNGKWTVVHNGYPGLWQEAEGGFFYASDLAVMHNNPVPSNPEIKIKKIDANTGAPMSGVDFHLRTQPSTGFVQLLTTGADGIVTFNDPEKLKPGNTYYIVELDAPDGYEEMPDSVYYLKVDVAKDGSVTLTPSEKLAPHFREENGTGIYIWENVPKNKIEIKIYKSDKDNPDKKLDGAEFVLRDDKDNDIYSGETENGELTFTNIGNGSYYLYETKQPEGYEKPKNNQLANIIVHNGKVDRVFNISGSDDVTVEWDKESTEIIFYVKNTLAEYHLPETGGPGTKWFTTGGLALLAAAGLMYKKLRRKEGKIL